MPLNVAQNYKVNLSWGNEVLILYFVLLFANGNGSLIKKSYCNKHPSHDQATNKSHLHGHIRVHCLRRTSSTDMNHAIQIAEVLERGVGAILMQK
jgi:hypothetical protein